MQSLSNIYILAYTVVYVYVCSLQDLSDVTRDMIGEAKSKSRFCTKFVVHRTLQKFRSLINIHLQLIKLYR